MDDNEAVAIEYIRRYVDSGFYGPEKILEILDESVFEPGEIDPVWLRARIEREFTRKHAEEARWPEITDCDRLDRAFASFEDRGIIALQNVGVTQSDGLSDVSQRYAEAGADRSGIEGYCFYDGQDLEGVVEDGELWLTFGAVAGDDRQGVEIGRRIEQVLEDAGFEIEWDGSIESRLLVKGLRWQRRGEPT